VSHHTTLTHSLTHTRTSLGRLGGLETKAHVFVVAAEAGPLLAGLRPGEDVTLALERALGLLRHCTEELCVWGEMSECW
jgi:hypothetical protein